MQNRYCVLLNRKASGGAAEDILNRSLRRMTGATWRIVDIMEASRDYPVFFRSLEKEEQLMIAGGDGTLYHFVNDTARLELPDRIWYCACGTGNDFLKDLGRREEDGPVDITGYLKSLPVAEMKGMKRRFLNCVGFGLDGYVCSEKERLRNLNPNRKSNYTLLGLKGLAYAFKPVNASVTVDGVTRKFRRVFLAPTMNGRYFGGGMKAGPDQDRNGGKVTLMVVHDAGRMRLLSIYPSIQNGTHVKHKNCVEMITGEHIAVEFDRACPVEIDGDVIPDVERYEVFSRG